MNGRAAASVSAFPGRGFFGYRERKAADLENKSALQLLRLSQPADDCFLGQAEG